MSSGCASSTATASSALNSAPAERGDRGQAQRLARQLPRRRSTRAPTVTGCGSARRAPAPRRRPRAPDP
jgi:hypothetical protein